MVTARGPTTRGHAGGPVRSVRGAGVGSPDLGLTPSPTAVGATAHPFLDDGDDRRPVRVASPAHAVPAQRTAQPAAGKGKRHVRSWKQSLGRRRRRSRAAAVRHRRFGTASVRRAPSVRAGGCRGRSAGSATTERTGDVRQIDVAPPGEVHARIHETGVQQTVTTVVKEFRAGLAWRTRRFSPVVRRARSGTPRCLRRSRRRAVRPVVTAPGRWQRPGGDRPPDPSARPPGTADRAGLNLRTPGVSWTGTPSNA